MTFRLICGSFALLFLLSAAVQWNDPDPARWIVVYAAVAAISAAAAFGVRPRIATAAVFGGVLAAFALWAPALEHTSLQALQSFGMSGNIEEEEVREAIGLGLALAWLAVLLIAAFRTPRGQRRGD